MNSFSYGRECYHCAWTFYTHVIVSWWRHQMETFSALLALCAGNSPVPVNSPHKGQWRGALMFSLIYAWINDWVNNREAGDLRRQGGHYGVIVMYWYKLPKSFQEVIGLLYSYISFINTSLWLLKGNRYFVSNIASNYPVMLKLLPGEI